MRSAAGALALILSTAVFAAAAQQTRVPPSENSGTRADEKMPIRPVPKTGSMKIGGKPSGAPIGAPPSAGEPSIGAPPTHKADEGGPPRPRQN